jgi:hypothetical protein
MNALVMEWLAVPYKYVFLGYVVLVYVGQVRPRN